MARLDIRLLGPFQVSVDGEPASGFDSDKVRALLAYLAVEADRPHRRETLAGLWWPEQSERFARTNLRRALTNLRQVIGDRQADPPFLDITRQTVQFNPAADYALDVELFSRLATPEDGSPEAMEELEEAIALYRGAFIEGFSIADAPAFEEWQRVTGESLQRQAVSALRRLAGHYGQLGLFDRGLPFARRQVELEPWQEDGHRQVMRLLALSGRRGQALVQYETCRQLLLDEIGVEPDTETQTLYKRILDNTLYRETIPLIDRAIRGYEVRERLGTGSFGVVYRAYQPAVRRDVAVKIIRPEYANQPNFIRRFDVEAQFIARLEHPHIVPLYDYWREPDGAYLVMRWLKAGSLEAALARGPWHFEPVAVLLDQIASALDVAHRQGVVHRDIKPANILLDEEGNAYLSDFGIATLTESVQLPGFADEPGKRVALDGTSKLSGSPEYVSPEQVQKLPVTPQADIYSLGILLFVLLTGRHPFHDTPIEELPAKHLRETLPAIQVFRPDLPEAVDRVIQVATAKEPSHRYKDALALATAFRQAIAGDTLRRAAIPESEPANPYKGLRPFLETDASTFFGRKALVERLIDRMADPIDLPDGEPGSRLLAIVGPSGSGKSSVTRAGLIPELRRGALPGSETWYYADMVPGSQPFEELETALLRIAATSHTGLSAWLSEDERGLVRAASRVLPDAGGQLVLLVDQFEELFTLVEDQAETACFLALLSTAASDPRSRVRLIITLRADYYDRPLRYVEFGELIRRNTEIVLPLSEAELKQAINGPAGQAGLSLEPGLASAIIRDIRDQPGALPMLQYALTELFEHRQGRRLTLEAYEAIGRVAGAIARRAETLYSGLDGIGQEATRQLFLRLVIPGESVEDARRRVPRSELIDLHAALFDAEPGVLDRTLDLYGRYRLLTFDRDPQTRVPTAEIAHEALLREWPRLREWLEKYREALRLHQRLAADAMDWAGTGREPSYLLRGTRLDAAAARLEASDLALTPVEQAFIEASLAERRAQQAGEEARRVERQALERRARTLRIALAMAVLLVLFAVIVGIGLSRGGISLIAGLTVDSPAAQATREASMAEYALYQLSQGGSVAFDPTGDRLAVAGQDNVPTIREIDSGEILLELHGHRDSLNSIAFSLDGRRLATTSLDGTARVWDAKTGENLLTVGDIGGELLSSVMNPDGTLLAVTSLNQQWNRLTARVWEVASGQETVIPIFGEQIGGLAFSPDGSRLAIPGNDGIVIIWDFFANKQAGRLVPHDEPVTDLVYSPDGRYMATVSFDGLARVWDLAADELLTTMRGHDGVVLGVDFNPDGDLLATGGSDRTVRVWEVDNGREVVTLYGHVGNVLNVSFSADGRMLASGGDDNMTIVWRLNTPAD